jgi:hypothetical protein
MFAAVPLIPVAPLTRVGPGGTVRVMALQSTFMKRILKAVITWLPDLAVGIIWIVSYLLSPRWMPLSHGWRAIFVQGTIRLHNPKPLRPGNIVWRRFGVTLAQQDPNIYNWPPDETTDPVPMYLVRSGPKAPTVSASPVPGATLTRVCLIGPVIVIPLWMPFALTSVLPAMATLFWIRARFTQKQGHCVACQYDLTGNTSGVCPECGTAIVEQAR